ncbi:MULTISPECIES: hypothetical protein [unclassified Rhodanobacter]|uniref:Uncharacterized protein n=1 Tax=Rhodanobacter humi TaxID=1888173 RepID=A0ABV4ALH7_9GAMM
MRTWVDVTPEQEQFLKRATGQLGVRQALQDYLTQQTSKRKQQNAALVEEIRDDLISAIQTYSTFPDENGHTVSAGSSGIFVKRLIREKNKWKKLAEEAGHKEGQPEVSHV